MAVFTGLWAFIHILYLRESFIVCDNTREKRVGQMADWPEEVGSDIFWIPSYCILTWFNKLRPS